MPLMLFGFLQMIVDATLWGISAYMIFVLIAKNQKHWQLGAWISAGTYFIWDEIIGSWFLSGAGVRVTNREISQLVGNDFANVDFFDLLLSIALAFGGFVLGRLMFRRATTGLALPVPDTESIDGSASVHVNLLSKAQMKGNNHAGSDERNHCDSP